MLLDSGAGRQIARVGVDANADSGASIMMNAKAFKVLSSTIYANKIGSMVRELYCNAVDSHNISGKANVPAVIHLPSAIEPYFSVQDFGVGMDDATVRNVYMGYFNSTKDGSNEQIGAFGLGSKTPFAYTDAFTVDAVKDGVRRSYSMFLNDAGTPTVSMMDEQPTTDCNGVTVTVPVTDTNDYAVFKREVQGQLVFMPVKPEVTNGIVSYFDYTSGAQIVRGDGYTLNHGYGQLFIVQGGVGYPLANDIVTGADQHTVNAYNKLRNIGAIIHVNIGDVEVTASREAVEYTKRTKASVQARIKAIIDDMAKQFFNEIEAIDNFWDFVYKIENSTEIISLCSDAYDKIKELTEQKFKSHITIRDKTSYARNTVMVKLDTLLDKLVSGAWCAVTAKYSRGKTRTQINGLNNNYVPGAQQSNVHILYEKIGTKRVKPRVDYLFTNNQDVSAAVNSRSVLYVSGMSEFADIKSGLEALGFVNVHDIASIVLPKIVRNVGTAPKRKYGKLAAYRMNNVNDGYDTCHARGESVRSKQWTRLEVTDMDDIESAYVVIIDEEDNQLNVNDWSKIVQNYDIVHELDYPIIAMKQKNYDAIKDNGTWFSLDDLDKDVEAWLDESGYYENYVKNKNISSLGQSSAPIVRLINAIMLYGECGLPDDLADLPLPDSFEEVKYGARCQQMWTARGSVIDADVRIYNELGERYEDLICFVSQFGYYLQDGSTYYSERTKASRSAFKAMLTVHRAKDGAAGSDEDNLTLDKAA